MMGAADHKKVDGLNQDHGPKSPMKQAGISPRPMLMKRPFNKPYDRVVLNALCVVSGKQNLTHNGAITKPNGFSFFAHTIHARSRI